MGRYLIRHRGLLGLAPSTSTIGSRRHHVPKDSAEPSRGGEIVTVGGGMRDQDAVTAWLNGTSPDRGARRHRHGPDVSPTMSAVQPEAGCAVVDVL